LELKNISKTETVQIKSLPKLSKGGAYERIKLTNEKEKLDCDQYARPEYKIIRNRIKNWAANKTW